MSHSPGCLWGLSTLCVWERSPCCCAITYVSSHGIFQLGQINIPQMRNPGRESGSSGDGGGEPVGMEHTLQCWGGGLLWALCVTNGQLERCLKGKEWPQCSCGNAGSPAQYGLLKLLTSLNKQSLCGQVWSLQEVIDFNYGSAEEKSELGVLTKLTADAPSPGGFLGSVGVTEQLSLPAVSIRSQPTLRGELRHFPAVVWAGNRKEHCSVNSQWEQPAFRSDLGKVTEGSASERDFWRHCGMLLDLHLHTKQKWFKCSRAINSSSKHSVDGPGQFSDWV